MKIKTFTVIFVMCVFMLSNASAQTNDGYGLGLTTFSASSTTVPQYESFTVNYRLRNTGREQFPINGQFGAALINSNGSIAGIIGTRDYGWALEPGWSTSAAEMTCNVPYTLIPGQYQLRMIVRPAGGEWRIVTATIDNAPVSISIQVLANNNVVVAPLLQTKWDQGSPYNDLFPYLPNHVKAGNNGRLVTDCGTTAAAQIIAFHRYPARAVGQSSILGPHNINMPLVNFENYPFDWVNMRNTYTTGDPGTAQERKAAGELMFIYGMARGDGRISSFNILVENFGYDRSFQRIERRFFTDAQWEALIRQQLDAGLPVHYYGNYPTDAASSTGYHAFVVDGYDNSGRFHANWGWSGSHDGWYFINDFDPKAPASTYSGEYIYINLKPDAGSTGSNIMGIDNFDVSKTTVQQNEMFAVSFTLKSFGFFPGGQRGAALVDSNNRIAAVIGSGNTTEWRPGSTASVSLNCFVPETISPGQYRVMAVTRKTDGEWKIVTLSDISKNSPNAVNISVTAGEANGGGYGFGLTAFSASSTSVSRNGSFTAVIGLRNMSAEVFPGGQRGLALVDNSGNITVVGSGNTTAWNPGASNNSITINCVIPNTVRSGQYRLRVVARPGSNNDNNQWRIVTMALPSVPNSIDFTVR